MNDKPTEKTISDLPVITKFIYSIGVLPTSYKMSMTYEEQVVWLCNYLETTIIPAVNQNGEAVEELQNLYELLRTYVNDYFDNLDVQEEINNKLESMAQDGSLTNLINAYIDPLIAEQNTNINNFKNQINSEINLMDTKVDNAVSGSPLLASDVSEMTNTERVYVNTTDGKWYYYDGDSWEIGGTYQSTEIADNSITLLMLDSNLQANFNFEVGNNLVSDQLNSVYYSINSSNKVISTSISNYSSYVYPLESGKTYLFNGFNPYSVHGLIIADSEDNAVYSTTIENTAVVSGASYLFNIKQNGMKAYINRKATTANSKWLDYYNTKLCEVNNIYNNLRLKTSVKLETTIENYYVDGSHLSDGMLVQYLSLNNYNIKIYRICKGLKYKINSFNIYEVPGIVITDSSYYQLYSSYDGYANPKAPVEYTFEATSNGFAILPEKEDTINHSISVLYDNISETGLPNNLSSKIVLWNGDSICEGAGNNGVSYASMISDQFFMTSTNYAVSGRCITKRAGQTSILETIPSMSSTADYVIFEGGWNDMYNVSLGTISEGYNAELDEYTWSGALESLIKQAKNKWPTAKIGFILPHGTADDRRATQDQFWDRAIEIFDKWNFPYIDLRHNGLCAFNNTLLDLFFMESQSTGHGDGTHPNDLGYETFYNIPIYTFMNRL